MTVRDSQHTLKRIARGGTTVNFQAHSNIVEIVDLPAGTFEGEESPAAGRAMNNDAWVERMGRIEHPQRCLARGFKNKAKGSAAGTIQEVCTQEEVMFPRGARLGRQRDVAEGCRGDLNLANRDAFNAYERSLDTATALQESGGQQEAQHIRTCRLPNFRGRNVRHLLALDDYRNDVTGAPVVGDKDEVLNGAPGLTTGLGRCFIEQLGDTAWITLEVTSKFSLHVESYGFVKCPCRNVAGHYVQSNGLLESAEHAADK